MRTKNYTPAQDRLLGTAPDHVIGKKIGRSAKSVERRRAALNVPPFTAHERAWTKRELSLLGTMPDAKLAARLGCARLTVLKKRMALGIAPACPENSPI